MNIIRQIVTSANYDQGRGGHAVTGIVLHTMDKLSIPLHVVYNRAMAYWRRQPTLKLPEKEVELAYLAGLFDGEGCIMLHKHTKTWRLIITSCDKALIDYLTSLGGIPTPKTRYSDKHSPAWNWYIYKQADVQLLLEAMLPYLRIKKDKSELAIAQIKTKGEAILHNLPELAL